MNLRIRSFVSVVMVFGALFFFGCIAKKKALITTTPDGANVYVDGVEK